MSASVSLFHATYACRVNKFFVMRVQMSAFGMVPALSAQRPGSQWWRCDDGQRGIAIFGMVPATYIERLSSDTFPSQQAGHDWVVHDELAGLAVLRFPIIRVNVRGWVKATLFCGVALGISLAFLCG